MIFASEVFEIIAQNEKSGYIETVKTPCASRGSFSCWEIPAVFYGEALR
jgi:hypothetical protein